MKPNLPLLALLAAASCGAQTYQTNGTSVPARPILAYTTNVVESDNHQGDPAWSPNVIPAVIGDISHWWQPYQPPTERTWTTNVTERLTVTLRVDGEERTLEQSRVVSSRSYTERLESKWVAKEQRKPTLEDIVRDDGVVYCETNKDGTVTMRWKQSVK